MAPNTMGNELEAWTKHERGDADARRPRRWRAVAGAIVVGCVLFAPQASASGAQPGAALAALEGTWTCADMVPGSPQPLRSTLHVVPLVPGSLYGVAYEQERNPLLDREYRSSGVWGYDAASGRYYRVVFDNFDGHDVGFSRGWLDGAFEWRGESVFFGQRTSYRGVFTKPDDDTYVSAYETRQGTGPWVPSVTSTCHR
jgi:hypothetical protein